MKIRSIVFLTAMITVGQAQADFVVINTPKAHLTPTSTAVKYDEKIVPGFGKQVVFKDLMTELKAEDWVIDAPADVWSSKVSWKGGKTWLGIVRDISRDNHWTASFDKTKKHIKIKNSFVTSGGTQVASNAAGKGVSTVVSASETNHSQNVVITGSLDEKIFADIRQLTLADAVKQLAPTGWRVDFQVDGFIKDYIADYNGEKTRGVALTELLEPAGLTYLEYENMRPSPLIVIVKSR